MAHDDAHQELRQAVRAVLKPYSERYWRALDQDRAYEVIISHAPLAPPTRAARRSHIRRRGP